MNSSLRAQIDSFLAAGDVQASAACLRQLWREERSAPTAAYVVSRYERLRERLPLVPHRLAILRSFTVEPAVPLLRAGAFVAGIDLTVQVGDFNAHAQELLDPGSGLY